MLRTIDQGTIQRLTRNEADMAFKKRVQTIFEWIDLSDERVILDCACGRGFYLKMIRTVSQCRLFGLELDPTVLPKTKRNIAQLENITLTQANIYHQPFEDNSFDGVILSEILEHVDDDVRGLKEVKRVLKPGGVAAITVPNANYPFWWDPINKTLETFFNTHIQHGPLAGIWANHVRLYTQERLRQAALDAGLIVEEERAFTHYSFPFIHNLVYGLGKEALEAGLLPKNMAKAADRTTFDENDGNMLNPINLGLAVFNWFDRPNVISEPEGRSTVNLCLKVRKPVE